MAFLPFFQVFLLHYVIGGDPTGLKLAVVNNEIKSYQDCFNSSLVTSIPLNDSCHLEKVSCRFLQEFSDFHVHKIFYKSIDEALQATKKDKLSAIIEFDSEFSKTLSFIDKNPDKIDEIDSKMIESSYIKIHMDNADMQMAYFVKFQIFSAYKNYTEKLMKSCGLSKTLKNFPMSFEKSFEGEMKDHQFPGMIIQ